MAKQKGTITKVTKGKFGYAVLLAERDGFYFNTKFNPSDCGEGDVVGIDFTQKGENRGNVTKITLITDNGGPKGHQEAASDWSEGSSSGGGSAPAGGDRNDRITWQSCQKVAAPLLATLVASNAIALPAKTKAPERYDILVAAYDTLVVKLFNDASDPRSSAAFKGEAAIEEDADGGWGTADAPPVDDDAWGSGDGEWAD